MSDLDFLSIKEAALICEVSSSTIENFIDIGSLNLYDPRVIAAKFKERQGYRVKTSNLGGQIAEDLETLVCRAELEALFGSEIRKNFWNLSRQRGKKDNLRELLERSDKLKDEVLPRLKQKILDSVEVAAVQDLNQDLPEDLPKPDDNIRESSTNIDTVLDHEEAGDRDPSAMVLFSENPQVFERYAEEINAQHNADSKSQDSGVEGVQSQPRKANLDQIAQENKDVVASHAEDARVVNDGRTDASRFETIEIDTVPGTGPENVSGSDEIADVKNSVKMSSDAAKGQGKDAHGVSDDIKSKAVAEETFERKRPTFEEQISALAIRSGHYAELSGVAKSKPLRKVKRRDRSTESLEPNFRKQHKQSSSRKSEEDVSSIYRGLVSRRDLNSPTREDLSKKIREIRKLDESRKRAENENPVKDLGQTQQIQRKQVKVVAVSKSINGNQSLMTGEVGKKANNKTLAELSQSLSPEKTADLAPAQTQTGQVEPDSPKEKELQLEIKSNEQTIAWLKRRVENLETKLDLAYAVCDSHRRAVVFLRNYRPSIWHRIGMFLGILPKVLLVNKSNQLRDLEAASNEAPSAGAA